MRPDTKGMRTRMVHVGYTHRLCGEDASEDMKLPLHEDARKLLKDGEADGAIITWAQGTLVGFFRYGNDDPDTIRAIGTWVHPDFRRQGLATRMWTKAMERLHTQRVKVRTISAEGKKLVEALKEFHADIEFGKLDFSA